MSDNLLRHDTLLPRGTKVELRVTSFYEIEVNDDILEAGAESITFANLEAIFGKYTSDRVCEVEQNYDRDDFDVDWYLANADAGDYRDVRFENEYLAKHPGRLHSDLCSYIELTDVLPKRATA